MATQNIVSIQNNELSSSIAKIKENAIAMDIIIGLSGAMIIGLLARVSIPLWFTPIPITGQTLGVIGCVLTMARYRGILSIVFYILLSMAGLPILASQETGWGGFSWLTKPVSEVGWITGASAGYVYGFLLGAIACKFFMRNNKSLPTMIGATFIVTLLTYICGIYWLHHVLNQFSPTPYFGGPKSAFALGCWPFLIGDILKSIVGITVAFAITTRSKAVNK